MELNAAEILELIGNTTEQQRISFVNNLLKSIKQKEINPDAVRQACQNTLTLIGRILSNQEFNDMESTYLWEQTKFGNNQPLDL
jgi:hypothetical protein